MKSKRIIGIIGIGPRGGYAFENLIIELISRTAFEGVHIYLYEETGEYGNGQVYALQQAEANWMNLSQRKLELEQREAIGYEGLYLPSFPSFHQWSGENIGCKKDDVYPPRAQIGRYLNQRFQSFVAPLLKRKMVTLVTEKVNALKLHGSGPIRVQTASGGQQQLDEVLLAIGHQPTEPDDELLQWTKFASQNGHLQLFESAYPISAFLEHRELLNNPILAIRGFGLSMIDVARAIANKFGNFSIQEGSLVYHKHKGHTPVLLPFSLDGLPPVPKPLNAEIDKWFEPDYGQLRQFEAQIGKPGIQRHATSEDFLIEAFAPVATAIYSQIAAPGNTALYPESQVREIVTAYLKNKGIEHPLIVSQALPAESAMQRYVGMASGKEPISLDYCIGQVWRHCQHRLYSALSFNECDKDVFAEVIELNEWTKRYSYGPPVTSIQQLLALIRAGVLNTSLANNPDIEMTRAGWKIKAGKETITATMLINSIVDAPEVKKVASPLVRKLLADDWIQPIHDDLGIAIGKDGRVSSGNKKIQPPIYMLGRLAKGTLIGVDSILQSFGDCPRYWAQQAVKRHIKWLESY